MKEVVIEINHSKKDINYDVIENRLIRFDFINKVQSKPLLKQINIHGVCENNHCVLITNALFQIGYTVNVLNNHF